MLSEDLVSDPEGTLRALCRALDLAWEPAMLSWPAGPKPEDGVWAPWWYSRTHQSTGFASEAKGEEEPAPRARAPLPEDARELLEECWAMYDILYKRALRPASAVVFSPPSRLFLPLPALQSGHLASSASAVLASQSPASEHVPSTHAYTPDARNRDVLVGIRDGETGTFSLVWRPRALVSVFQSAFILGDGVWEGLRVHRGRILSAGKHLDRLFEGAAALGMDLRQSPRSLLRLLYRTLDANGMTDGVHVRLMATRGLKATPYQSPAATIGAPCIVIVAEHKVAGNLAEAEEEERGRREAESASASKIRGLCLATSHVRRGRPDAQDQSWNSHSKLNCIAACVGAQRAGADEALMLDPQGFVATCNSTNFFLVRGEEVWTPTTKYQLHGITRATVIRLCREAGVPCLEKDFSLTQVYSADEAFVTGTFAGLTPVAAVDGRVLQGVPPGRPSLTRELQRLYVQYCDAQAALGRKHEDVKGWGYDD